MLREERVKRGSAHARFQHLASHGDLFRVMLNDFDFTTKVAPSEQQGPRARAPGPVKGLVKGPRESFEDTKRRQPRETHKEQEPFG